MRLDESYTPVRVRPQRNDTKTELNMSDKNKKLQFSYNVTLGCDPEFFFSGSRGQTTGAEKVLPEAGLVYPPGTTGKRDGDYTSCGGVAASKIVIDGVQAELNPRPNTCRANLGNEISACFRQLHTELEKNGKKIGVSFKPLVNITQKELDSLSEKSKTFGCAPSTNLYQHAESKITVDPKKYKKRSAGGHIHLGAVGGYGDSVKNALANVDEMVYMLDIIVGNTSVLLDRDPNNVERRKVYGRAGEYRAKSYGIEYRTLSNYWLQSYQLMSFVTGLARMAVHIVAQSSLKDDGRNFAGEIKNAVKKEDIVKAIQENDFALAYSNFLKIQDILTEIASDVYSYPINKVNINQFHWFVKKGISYWFKEDPFKHWITLPEGHGRGFESFLTNKVSVDMAKSKELSEALIKQIASIKDLKEEISNALKELEPAIEKPVKKTVEVKEAVAR